MKQAKKNICPPAFRSRQKQKVGVPTRETAFISHSFGKE